MKVLIIGRGGREHALAKAISLDKDVKEVFVAPGSPGMLDVASVVNIDENDFKTLVYFARKEKIGLTIVGPEDPLEKGIVDYFKEAGLNIFGPTKEATKIESSKGFAKELMEKYKIPTANYKIAVSYIQALGMLEEFKFPLVIKEDGLKAGKGVYIIETREEALQVLKEIFKNPNKVVFEEFLKGEEFSLISLVHQGKVIPLEVAQDFKKAYDGDKGLNTGGMGSYSPVTNISQEIIKESLEAIVNPTVQALTAENKDFTGFLYAGLILTEQGVKVIEFNARLGDPETEVILPRLKSSLYKAIKNLLQGEIEELLWSPETFVGVVLAGKKYPKTGSYGIQIFGLEKVKTTVYHMGTKKEADNYLTNGGRVLIVVAQGRDLKSATKAVYQEVIKIKSEDLYYRKDIGYRK